MGLVPGMVVSASGSTKGQGWCLLERERVSCFRSTPPSIAEMIAWDVIRLLGALHRSPVVSLFRALHASIVRTAPTQVGLVGALPPGVITCVHPLCWWPCAGHC